MTYSIIGTGNMAWFLAQRMLAAGHICVGIYGRDEQATAALASAFHFPVFQDLAAVNDGPDVCLLAVSDHAVATVRRELSFKTTVLIHTAGALNLSVLAGSAALAGVVWPIYSINRNNLPVHRQFPTVWEAGSGEARPRVTAVAAAISDIRYEADTVQRQWLHLAAVLSNNFVNHLLGISADICAARQLPYSLLQPIVQQTVSNAVLQHPHMMQTGPAKRADEATMTAQLKMLEGNPYAQAIYAACSVAIRNRFNPKEDRD